MTFNFKNISHKHLFFRLAKSVFLLLISITFTFPYVSEAGVISFVTGFFSGQSVSAQVESQISSSSQDMALLEPANNINPGQKSGSEILIDGGEAVLAETGPSGKAPEKADSSNGQISTYLVRSGDTLAEIAKMYDISVNTILWANDMTKNSTLKVGQTLVILPITGVIHNVTSGDTLSTIAKKYGGDIEEIASFNDLKTTDKISVGDKILIPDGQMSSSLRPSIVSSSNSSRIISSSGPALDGYYLKPFNGGVRTQGIHGYNAVDYGLPKGSSIFASAPGKVLISKNSGWNGGYGNYIVIEHPNNTQTVYAHLTSSIVSVGQTVDRGQTIGYSGNTGRSIGPTGQHLHFEIRGAKNPF